LIGCLGHALTAEQVAHAVLTESLAALDADAGIVALLSEDGTALVVVGVLGYAPNEVAPWHRVPAESPVPLADAVRSRRPIFLDRPPQHQAQCPQTARFRANPDGALTALPLTGREGILGGVGLNFSTQRCFSEADREFLLTLASLCAQSLERVRLLDARQAPPRKPEQEHEDPDGMTADRDRFFAGEADLLAVADFDGRLHWVSPNWERTIGWTARELTDRPYLDFVHEDDREATRAEAARLASGGETVKFENRFRCKDGTYRWISWKARPSVSQRLIHAGATDITERKQAEEALRESEERFRQLAENVHAVFWMSDLRKTRILYISPAYETIWGRSCQSLYEQPLSFADAIHPADRGRVLALSLERQARGETADVEYRIVRPDGAVRWIRDRGFPVRDSTGRAYRMAGIAEDITETRNDQEALRLSESRFRLLAEVMPQLVWSSFPDGSIDYCNPRWLDYTGMKQEQVQGEGWTAALHPDDREATMAAWRQATATGQEYQVEQRLRAGSGEYRRFLTRALPLYDGDRVVKWFGTCTDIEDQKRAEEERRSLERKLQEGQKLESLGVLAGGIAHDFNNLLTAILGNASLIELEVPAGSSVGESLGKIVQVAERAAGLCRQLLAYSGRGHFVLVCLDLTPLVREMLELLEVSISKKATLHLDLAEGLPAVLADATQLRQVVMNLVINASEAIGDRPGTIRVATGVRQIEDRKFVFLEVADSGCGMDEETRKRIFDPFFTTKFTGRGLGLAAVQGIARGHKGSIEVESEPGRGSTFRLLLPAVTEEVRQRQEPLPRAVPWLGEGTILVADDEAWVRDVAARLLRSLGFGVLLARDGEEALARWHESADEIRLVLLDLTMPKLDGEETFRVLHLLRPDLPVVLMSGFSEHEAAGRFAGKGLAGFLAKPFRLEDLAECIRGVLARR
jgi:PAS domain S-box-containing protein